MRTTLLAVLVVAAGLTGCIGDQAPEGHTTSPQEDPTPPTQGPHREPQDLAGGVPSPSGAPPTEPAVVVAVIDGGVNLYHIEFSAPDRWTAEQTQSAADLPPVSQADGAQVLAPATARAAILDRLPTDPIPVELSVGPANWSETMEEDKARLLGLEPGQLYTFPGTKILAGISFLEPPAEPGVCLDTMCQPDTWPLILEQDGGHGTMGSSRAVGNNVSIPGSDPGIWLVAIQAAGPEAVTWAAEQPWIDIVQISGTVKRVGPGLAPGLNNVLGSQEEMPAVEHATHVKPVVLAAQNGLQPGGFVGYPSWLEGYSGLPDAISVGATDNGYLTVWDNQDKYVAADGCLNPAAEHDSLDEVRDGGFGTSSASPFTAGGVAKLLLEARRLLGDTGLGPRVDTSLSAPERVWDSGYAGDAQVVLAQGQTDRIDTGPLADGVFTMLELKDVLYHTALVTPTVDESDGTACGAHRGESARVGYDGLVDTAQVPMAARFPFQGYGEINALSIQTAIDVLAGDAELPQRPMDDQRYQEAHHRRATATGQP